MMHPPSAKWLGVHALADHRDPLPRGRPQCPPASAPGSSQLRTSRKPGAAGRGLPTSRVADVSPVRLPGAQPQAAHARLSGSQRLWAARPQGFRAGQTR